MSFKLMYNDNDDDDRSNLTKAVIMALITATYVISLISFSYNAEAQIFGDDNDNQIGSQETRGILVSDTTTTAEGPAAKAGIQGDDSFADIRGRYIEVSRIINIPKDMPNSSSSEPNTSSSSEPNTSSSSEPNTSSSSEPNGTTITNATIPNTTNLTSNILTYQNSSYGVRIQYPANWTKDEGDFTPNKTVTNIVTFYAPVENTPDNYSENLAIYTKRLADQNMTLEKYADSLITYYNETLTDFNPIELNTNITLIGGNNTAYGLIYTDREDNINYKRMEIGTIIGDKVYYIRYNAEEKKYSNYLPTIQMMINSLQIT